MEVAWEYGGLFLSSFLAATILPFSSEGVFLTMLATGYEPLSCLLVATVGNAGGGFTNLVLGRYSRPFFLKKGNTLKGETLIHKYGAWIAWLSWIPVIGDPLLIAAGFYRTPFLLTSLFMVAGKAGRYLFIAYLYSLTQ